jgi:hypothetical protein
VSQQPPRTAATGQPPAQGYGYYPPAQAPPQDPPKGFAITSLVLGILSLVAFYGGIVLGPLAIIFGAISLAKRRGGRGMAIAGLVCGIIASLVWIAVIIALAASSKGSH